MAQIKTKEEAIQQLNSMPEKALIRIAELSTNEKALKFFTNPIKFGVLKGYLNSL